MLAKLQQMLGNNISKFSGQKDFLEAVCAASALIAVADGEIEDSEVEGLVKTIAANAILTQAFNRREIEQCAEEMLKRAQGGRMGRSGLHREIEDIAADPDKAEVVLLAALDVAESDGQIEPEEQTVLEKIASDLKVDLRRLMAA
jgi:tellurite resistance protein TerB